MKSLANLRYLFLGVRFETGMSKEAFQKATKINSATISKLENGIQKPTLDNLERYAKFLKCDVYQIIEAVELEQGNHLSHYIAKGKECLDISTTQRQLNAMQAFNKLSDDEKQKFLEQIQKSE